MPKSESDSFDLRVALRVSDAEERLLRAIRCPNSGIGVIDALGFAISSIDVLLKVEELPRVKQWRKVAKNLILKCGELEEGQNADEAHTELRSLSPSESISVFSVLANPPTNTLDEGQTQNSLEILGRLIAAACSNGTALNSLAIDGWATLRRSGQHRRGRSPDWHQAAASIPRNPTELNEAFKYAHSIQLRVLLEEIQLAIATSITEPINAPDLPGFFGPIST